MKPLTQKERQILELCAVGKTTRNLRKAAKQLNNPAYPYILEKLETLDLISHSEGQWRITEKGHKVLSEAQP